LPDPGGSEALDLTCGTAHALLPLIHENVKYARAGIGVTDQAANLTSDVTPLLS
jgi:hypothetical protein